MRELGRDLHKESSAARPFYLTMRNKRAKDKTCAERMNPDVGDRFHGLRFEESMNYIWW